MVAVMSKHFTLEASVEKFGSTLFMTSSVLKSFIAMLAPVKAQLLLLLLPLPSGKAMTKESWAEDSLIPTGSPDLVRRCRDATCLRR